MPLGKKHEPQKVLVGKPTAPSMKSKAMKRIGNLYERIIAVENLQLADQKRDGENCVLTGYVATTKQGSQYPRFARSTQNKTFKTSKYETFIIKDPKEREIYRLPYFPDRIVHHAIMNILEPIWVSVFTTDTFSCIKNRGINGCMLKVDKALKDVENTRYCLKIDVKKFYPSIDHDVLKQIVRRKIKCPDTLALLDQIIDSAAGVPIGNYLSQYFANLFLAYFDHWIKEEVGVKYYFRYADDMVFLHKDKAFLHDLLTQIDAYLRDNLHLTIKANYQVFPIAKIAAISTGGGWISSGSFSTTNTS